LDTQVSRTLVRGSRAARLVATLLLALMPCVSASARVHHNDAWARQQFVRAERMREALNGRPSGDRTRREYQRVIDAYRRVYFGAPTSSKADPSVVATAELMVEMGRRFDDNKVLRGAIEQYWFLRKEYPGSKYRFDALFTIGEIYKDDLDDPEEAQATFENFLHRYPRNHLADDARAALQQLDTEADALERASRKVGHKSGPNEKDEAGVEAPGPSRGHNLPRVTGVRHWSTPDYTRVAIDVEQEVKFDSQRLDQPARIFFDLHDTKLASTLVGKTFEVDDGFLKKVRVAQFQPGRTRVVLEVDDLSSYNAFLLPNPYRLIIDIHGKRSRETLTAEAQSAPDSPSAAPESAALQKVSRDQTETASSAKLHGAKSQTSARDATADNSAAEHASVDPAAQLATPQSATPAKASPGAAVSRTTTVNASGRKITKTIVDADDDVPATVASLDPEKLRPDVTPAQRTAIEPAKGEKASKPEPRKARGRKSRPAASAADTADLEVREARPTAAGDRSLTRALGLKIGRIVIDAGHGGHDTGTIGPNGLLEKDLVLDVAKRLGRLLETRLGAEVIYTRQDDTFVPLETRTAIANQEQADLFISIHANSSRDADARGVETYYLNFTSSAEALEVAARENAVSEKSIHELQDLVKKIALKEKIEESREFATDVQESLYGGLSLRHAGVRNRGVKKAPFIVLIGANMPSILAEISFVSNPTDERKLETAEHRQRIAESLYRGVSKYVSGLSGVKVASKGSKSEGQ
jgi:N-acetylmuramoyl-L-alanine amidase